MRNILASNILISFTFLLVISSLIYIDARVTTASSSVTVTAVVPGICGNGIKEVNETCDGADLGGKSCTTLGYQSGTLSCHTDCSAFIVSSCVAASLPPSGGGGGGGGSSSGGGGGGGSSNTEGSGIALSGRAYPGSVVTLLKDARVAGTTISDPVGSFNITLGNLTAGNYIFSLYSEDKYANRSSLSTFPISVTNSYVSSLTGIFLSPTITVDKQVVKKGDVIKIFGQSAPNSEITITVNSEEEIFVKANSDKDGVYLYNFESSVLAIGDHSTKSRAAKNEEISPLSSLAIFKVGTENIYLEQKRSTCKIADVNCDGRVNLVDFSILSYWFRRSGPPVIVDLSRDGKVDLVDFSIMAYHWTG